MRSDAASASDPPVGRDLPSAHELLGRSTYAPGDTFRIAFGTSRRFTLAAGAVRDAVESLGIPVELVPTERSSELFADGLVDAVILSWFPDYADPDAYIVPLLHSSSVGTGEGVFFADTQVDRLVEQRSVETDSVTRRRLTQDLLRVVDSIVPVVPLWFQPIDKPYRNRLAGFNSSPFVERFLAVRLPTRTRAHGAGPVLD